MSTTKRDTIATIKARMEEIEPYLREYNAYVAALEALGAPMHVAIKDLVEDEETTAERRQRAKRRRLIQAPVAKEQRFEEILTVMYDHPDEYMTCQRLSDLTPSESTPGAIGHRMNELLHDGAVEKFKDEKSGRTTIDGFYAYRITDKGIRGYEATHPELKKDDKEEVQKRRQKMTVHVGHGVVPPSK